MGESMKGKIKFFNKEKGFGFIIDSESKQELFFHISDVEQENKNLIEKDIDVMFEIGSNKKGECAKKIKLITERNRYMIPRDTSNLNLGSFDNFYLKLNKFAKYVDDKFSFYNKEKRIDISSEYNFNPEFVKTISGNYKKAINRMGYTIVHQLFQPDWRLIVGLGNPSVYETSITLHHIYGVPYIPGSAIKGITRAHFIQTEFEKTKCKWEEIDIFEKVLETLDIEKDKILEYEDKEKGNKKIKGFKSRFFTKNTKDLENLYDFFYKESRLKEEIEALILKFRTIFGTQSQQGKVIFFDAFPKTEPKLEIDVMNPHYSDYYSGKKDKKGNFIPPADYLNPVPIYFLTVADTEFEFFIGCKKKDSNYLAEVQTLLEKALQKHGIGAKTAVNYGYMNLKK